jgi:RNA polymerase sigma-70 factor (ECF subfamily)
MHELDDVELLALLKKDSLEAYEIFFKKYYKLLCFQAALLLSDQAEAEDLVQELFIQIWDKKLYRQIDQSLKSYLYRAVRNKCINEIRKHKVIRQNQENYKEYRLKKKEPTSWVEQKELTHKLRNVLQEFPAQRLRAFTLVYMENKKYQEAADEMGVSVNSVKTHLRLALQVLRDKLSSFL